MFIADPMDHPNLVVIHYPSYAGGKFWINCLAHHPHVLPLLGDTSAPENSWLFSSISDVVKQNLKIGLINKSLPPVEDMHNWSKYELGDGRMWGGTMSNLLNPHRGFEIPLESQILLDQYRCFVINHTVCLDQFNQINQAWPLAKHIVLHNTLKFQQLAAKLKQPDFPVPVGTDSLDIRGNENVFYIDVDNTIFDDNKVLRVVLNCLRCMGLDTDLHPNINGYVTDYLKLHRL